MSKVDLTLMVNNPKLTCTHSGYNEWVAHIHETYAGNIKTVKQEEYIIILLHGFSIVGYWNEDEGDGYTLTD